jgi:predicted hotdog family 3-hydroxylacyl-ACP dehydratase
MNLLEKEITDSDFIGSLIPQKKPFIMVDKLSHFSEKNITSAFTISPENIFVKENQFTEPGLIENMAQTIALHTGYKYFLEQKPAPTGYIGAIKKAEVFVLPLVSQELRTSVEILHDIMGVTLIQASVSCNGKVIAQSEMKTALAKEDEKSSS